MERLLLSHSQSMTPNDGRHSMSWHCDLSELIALVPVVTNVGETLAYALGQTHQQAALLLQANEASLATLVFDTPFIQWNVAVFL